MLLRALAGWFHDEETITFFRDLERSAPDGEPVLLAQMYLLQHKQAVDHDLMENAIRELSDSAENRDIMLEYAKALRDQAFVPWLISAFDRAKKGEQGWRDDVEDVLQRTTLVMNTHGKAAWEEWFKAHHEETREDWVRNAFEEFEKLWKADPQKAEVFLQGAMYRWNDPRLLPFVRKLLPHRRLHNVLSGWINLTYSPLWRADLKELAEAILAVSKNHLEPWATRCLRNHGFLPVKESTWQDYVHGLNRRV
jgi:hypothetical protein